MRKSLSKFIETCHDIRCNLQVSGYELHDYEDGAYADFKVRGINDPRSLLRLCGQLCVKMLSDEDRIVVRVFEDFKEYDE